MRATALAVLTALLAVAPPPARAQVDTIVPNPKLVTLREIWRIDGSPIGHGADEVGRSAGSLGDLDGDGLGEFFVTRADPYQVMVYKGDTPAPSTIPTIVFDSSTAPSGRALTGDFWGDGRISLTVAHGRIVDGYYEGTLTFHRADSTGIDSIASAEWISTIQGPPRYFTFAAGPTIADLDNDGDDELIVSNGGYYTRDTLIRRQEFWIYEGGPGFQLDTPSVILTDDELQPEGGDQYATIVDLDGDGNVDLLRTYEGPKAGRYRTNVHWGDGRMPRAGVTFVRLYHDIVRPILLDCDGDGRTDMVTDAGDYYLSGSGKSMRTRSFDSSDVDLRRRQWGYRMECSAGHLNGGQYDAIVMIGGPFAPDETMHMVVLSGGPHGPDSTYEAEARYNDLALWGKGPLLDVNGDGWDDFISGSPSWPTGNWRDGIAIIFAGGPYIPRDSLPQAAIHDVELEGRAAALSVWPNPAREEVNIAWRGDLAMPPRRFMVHDLVGQLVASGDVEAAAGAALWRVDHVAAGEYLLSITDRDDSIIATIPIIVLPR